MPWSEAELKKHLKQEEPARLYVLYGEEPYLSAHYAEQIVRRAMGKGAEDNPLGEFNYQKFDGQEASWDAIEEAAEALPLMADRKCVLVKDYDVAGAGTALDRVMALAEDPPEDTVLIFQMDAVKPEVKKSAKWRQFLAAAEKSGVCVLFKRKTEGDIVKLLCSGAYRRGCLLTADTARLLVEQCGNDLNLLLNELDKLCAMALGTADKDAEVQPEITRSLVERSATKNLEASVFDLSKAILQNQYDKAYTILHRLFSQKEDPVSILAVLSNAYADLYRAKVAGAAGVPAESLTADFSYRGREFRLRYAARDCSRLSIQVLRESLEILARADITLKSSRMEKTTVLEQTAARLILTAKMGGAAK
jgi:DNA polymerase-3 subunit delta